MYKTIFTFVLLISSSVSFAQSGNMNSDSIIPNKSYADYQAFIRLVEEVENHRAERMISLGQFNTMKLDSNTVILDTRSKAMYDAKHIKGALHLNFADFTQRTLWSLIPDTNTRILIYCNNNFMNDQEYFPTKMAMPEIVFEDIQLNPLKPLGITMALNIPTYINLYGYGYKNVYELRDLISVRFSGVEFEGTAVY